MGVDSKSYCSSKAGGRRVHQFPDFNFVTSSENRSPVNVGSPGCADAGFGPGCGGGGGDEGKYESQGGFINHIAFRPTVRYRVRSFSERTAHNLESLSLSFITG